MSARFGRWFGGVAAVATLVAFSSASGQVLPRKGVTPRAPAGAGAQVDAKGAAGAQVDTAKGTTGAQVDAKGAAGAQVDAKGPAGTQVDAAKDAAQDTRRDVRDAVQDTKRDARDAADASRDFAAENLRGADLGLWLSTQGNALVVSDIATQGAIAQLGFREGDRIISVNGQPVTSEQQFMQFLLAPNARNQQLNVIVFRGGQQQTFTMQPSVLLQNVATYDPWYQYGFVVDDRIPDRLVVQRVFPRTPAYYWGLRAGDVITTVGGQPVGSLNDLSRLFQRSDANLALQINRNNQARQIQIDTSNIGARTALRPNLDTGARLDAQGRAQAEVTTTTDTQPNLNQPAGIRAVAPPTRPTRPTPEGTPTRPGTPTAPNAANPATPNAPVGTAISPGRPATALPATPTAPATPAIGNPATPATNANPAAPATPGATGTGTGTATPAAAAPGPAPAASGTGGTPK